MISTPEPASSNGRRWGGAIAPLLVVMLAFSAPGRAGGSAGEQAWAEAGTALSRGDGVAGEMALRRALDAGFARERVAARMGEALLDQGDRIKAREWLGPARFAPSEAAHGLRMLGRLELAEGNLGAADSAFGRALALAPEDAGLWVDVARLRYLRGDQAAAIDAAAQAVDRDPGNVRALELRGLMVRDAFGLAAGLPWFEAGLQRAPGDAGLLAEYAATLGEMGRASEMLTVTRHLLELDGRNARAFHLQAVLAARAGDIGLARRLLDKAGRGAEAIPGVLLLRGALELQAGNANAAADVLERLVALQPSNWRGQMLMARALYLAGNCADLTARMDGLARRPDAPRYLLTVQGRCLENLNRREEAAAFLDRAAAPAPWVPLIVGPQDAAAASGPRTAEDLALAGDVRLSANDTAGAVDFWRQSARIRLTDGLIARLTGAYVRAGRSGDAAALLASVRTASPRNRIALRLSASLMAGQGQWAEAARILTYLDATGDSRDAALLADLAVAQARSGQQDEAVSTSRRARLLQRGSPAAAAALAAALSASGGSRAEISALEAAAHSGFR